MSSSDSERQMSRRDFLRLASVAGATGALAEFLVGCATTPEPPKAPAQPAAQPSAQTQAPAQAPAQAPTKAPAQAPTKQPLTEDRKVRDIELIVTTADYDPIRYEFGLMAADNWKKLGFGVKVTPMEFTRLSQQCAVDKDFDTFTLNWAGRADRLDPDFFLYMVLHSSQVGKGQQNINGYQSAEYDKYAELQRATMNQEERRKAVLTCQEIFVRDQPQIPICSRNQLMPYNTRDWDNATPMVGEGLNAFWNFINIKPKTSNKILRWGYPSDVSTLNPLATLNNHDFQVFRLIYDRLMQIDTQGVAQKWAAEDVKTVNDTTIDVTLRSGLKFHDGQPVTAEDVKFSFEYPAQIKSGFFLGLLDPIKEVTVTGDRSVRFILKQPFAPFYGNCLGQVFILPKHVWQDVPEKLGLSKAQDFANEKPVGSGVFKLDYWRRNEEMKLSANLDHFSKPNIEGIIKIPYANVQGMVAGVQTGECDFGGYWIEPAQARELTKSAPNIQVIDVPDIGYYHINYNLRRKPFVDLAVRKAMAHAVPKQQIMERLLEGHGDITDSLITPANKYWHNPNTEKVDFNMDKARQILQDAGYEWGSDGRIYFPPGKTN